MEDKNKKKILIGSIIIVITLILVIVGTTYAYFALEITGNNTNSTVHITTGEANNIELTGKLENYHIRINASDMAYSKKNSEYYGTDTEDNYVETKEDGTKIIGTLKVNGTLKEENKCSAKVNVSLSGNMEPQEKDLELTIINDQFIKTIDLSKLEENNPVELEFILQDNIPNITQTIKAYLLLRNQDKDQSYLANKTLSVSIKIEDLKCTNDTTSPVIEEFYIKDKTNKYTNQIENTAHLTWSDSDVTEYCITETEGSNNCTWKTVQGNSATETITLSPEEGEHKYYAYLKDEANNISTGNMFDTIIYDITAPTIESAIAEDITYNGFNINITANDNKEGVSKTSGIDKYCYGTEDSLEEEKYTCVENSKISINGLQELQSYTYYVYAKDKAGNGSPIDKKSYVFKTVKKTIKDSLQEKGEDTFILKNGMYRFVGTKDQVTNNYICFGTDDTETCTKTPEDYMYRIIGMTSEDDNKINLPADSLKIIKAIPSSTLQSWNVLYSKSGCETDGEEKGGCKWDASEMKDYLNGTFYNSIKNAQPNGAYWDSIILSHSWYNEDYKNVPNTEPTTSHTTASKIGLMYAIDYKNSGDQNTNNWLFIKNGWNGNASNYEWTLSRYGLDSDLGGYGAWRVTPSGELDWNFLFNMIAVRPVFYVNPNISLTGEGTTTDPFIIHS